MTRGSAASSEILVRIRKITRAINLESKKIQREYGVSIPQVLCLSFLDSLPGKQSTLKEIARYLELNSSTVSGIINRLEKHNLAVRLPKMGDRRTTLIALTSHGEKVLKSIPPLLQDKLTSHLEGASGQEIGTLTVALDQIISLLGIEEIEAAPVLAMNTDLSGENEILKD